MEDPDHSSNDPQSSEDRHDLRESFSKGAQLISNPPPADAEIPQGLLGAPTPIDNADASEE